MARLEDDSSLTSTRVNLLARDLLQEVAATGEDLERGRAIKERERERERERSLSCVI